jgi:hypothetical protein
MIDEIKSASVSLTLISFHSGFLAYFVSKQNTGSRAAWTCFGGFMYDFSSFNWPDWIPDTASWAAIRAGSASPRSFSTLICLAAISSYLIASSLEVFSARSFCFSAAVFSFIIAIIF